MDERRRKLLFRAWRRGIRELDLIFGHYAENNLPGLSDAELDEFEAMMDVPDLEMFAWITGTAEIPAEYNTPMLDQLKQFKYSATSE